MQHEFPLLYHLTVGERAALASRLGDGAVSAHYHFHSSDPDVVTVDAAGVLSGRAPGKATVRIADTSGAAAFIAREVQVLAADDPPVPLQSEHPRLRFTAAELTERRALLATGHLPRLGVDLGQRYQELLARADAYAAEQEFILTYHITGEVFTAHHPLPLRLPAPLPQPYGFTDYPFWTRFSREVEQRLTTLTLAYSLTGERRYAEQAKASLLALVRWPKWHEYDKPTNNLSLPHFTLGAAIAYDELWSLLTSDERATIVAGIVELGLRPMSYAFGARRDHNGPVLFDSALVVGFLAVGDEWPQLEKYFHTPLANLRWYLAQRDLGETTEGLLYTAYAMNNLLAVASQVRRATGRADLWQGTFLRTTMSELYLYFRGGEGGLANLSDAGHEDGSAPSLARVASEFADPLAGWLIHRYHRDNTALLLHLDRDLAVASPTALRLPASKVFTSLGWAALRSGWDDGATLLAFTASGSAAGHNHFDQNSFILNVAGEWLLTDPGYQNYTPGAENVFTNATLGHNALLVNGEGQGLKGRARIVDQFLTPGFDYVAGDASAPYGDALACWERRIAYHKPDYLLIADAVIPGDRHDRVELLYHAQLPILLGGQPLALGTRYDHSPAEELVVTGHQAEVGVRVLTPIGAEVGYEQYRGAERFGAYLRVQLPPAATQHAVTLLQPRSGTGGAGYPATVTTAAAGCWVAIERGDEGDLWWLGQDGTATVATNRDVRGRAALLMVTRAAHRGTVRRLIMLHGTLLAVAQQELLAAEHAAAADLELAPGGLTGTIHLAVAGWVSVPARGVPQVRVDGAIVPPAGFAYNPERANITLTLAPGTHQLVLTWPTSLDDTHEGGGG